MSRLYLIAGALVAALSLLAATYLKGHYDGRHGCEQAVADAVARVKQADADDIARMRAANDSIAAQLATAQASADDYERQLAAAHDTCILSGDDARAINN